MSAVMPGMGLAMFFADHYARMRQANLGSPAHAVSGREKLETEIASDSHAAVNRFLVQSEAMALDSLFSPTLLAAGTPKEPFSLGRVLARWSEVVTEFMTAFRLRISPRLDNDAYLKAVEQRLLNLPMADLVYDAVASSISVGSAKGKPDLTAISKAISEALSFDPLDTSTTSPDWKGIANRIARTESTAAYNQATLLSLMDDPEFTHKRWVSRHDDVTRPSHLGADGQTVPLHSSFIVGTSAMQAPGDPFAPTHETANCRCVMVGVRKQPGAHRATRTRK